MNHPRVSREVTPRASSSLVKMVLVCLISTASLVAAAGDIRPLVSEGGRTIRRVLAENGFVPEGKFEEPSMAFSEPSMTGWPHAVGDKTFFVTTFDPPPSRLVTLSKEQAMKFATILADRKSYNISFGGKACVFHADVAIRVPGDDAGIYIVICFGCDQLLLVQHGVVLAKTDIDRGSNRLLELMRSILPESTNLKERELDDPKESEQTVYAAEVLDWAKRCIPDDPLFKTGFGNEAGKYFRGRFGGVRYPLRPAT